MSPREEMERTRCELAREELERHSGPYQFAERFADLHRRQKRPRTKHIADMSITIGDNLYWMVIGGSTPTSLYRTVDALRPFEDMTWEDCDVDYDPVVGFVAIRVRKTRAIAA